MPECSGAPRDRGRGEVELLSMRRTAPKNYWNRVPASWALPIDARPREPAAPVARLQNRWLAAPLAGAVVATSLWYLPEPIQ